MLRSHFFPCRHICIYFQLMTSLWLQKEHLYLGSARGRVNSPVYPRIVIPTPLHASGMYIVAKLLRARPWFFKHLKKSCPKHKSWFILNQRNPGKTSMPPYISTATIHYRMYTSPLGYGSVPQYGKVRPWYHQSWQ